MHAAIRYIYNSIKYLIAPPFCVYCACWLSEQTIFCVRCADLIQPIVSTSLAITPSVSMKVFALSSYQEPLKSLILAKSQSQRLASMHLGRLLWDFSLLTSLDFDYIVPIPLHWTRYAYRGYNQAEVIASVISQKCNKPVVHLLKRNRRTLFQSQLSAEQRKDNLADAFDLKLDFSMQQLFEGKHILLVDDLMTTGTTLKVAARKLLLLKPAKISTVVVCRTA